MRATLPPASSGSRRRPPSLMARCGGVLLAPLLACSLGCGQKIEPPAPPPPAVLIPPLHDTELGEQLILKRGLEEHVYTVVQAGDASVEVEVQKYQDGELHGPPRSVTWSRNGFGMPDGTVIRRIERARTDVAGKTWDCWLVHVHSRKGQFYAYISEDAPVHGVLQMMRTDGGKPDKRTMLEMVERR